MEAAEEPWKTWRRRSSGGREGLQELLELLPKHSLEELRRSVHRSVHRVERVSSDSV